MNKLRMRFSKTGRAIYISHLDLMHTMQRAFNRAGYELAYSEGFNPHPLISIAMPLSVGTSSVCELMDFRLRVDTELTDMPERLTKVMPEGIVISEVYEAEIKASEIKWLRIEGIYEYDNMDLTKAAELLTEYFSQPEIMVQKKSKKGLIQADIRPGIKELSFSPEGEHVAICAVLSAADPTVNPDLFAASLRQYKPELVPDFTKFNRVETYDKDMNVFR